MPSAAFLRSLPTPASMRRRLRTLAMLDTIVAPTTRSFEWHPRWNGKEQQAGGFKDGEGNFFFAWFCSRGAVVRGFDHESRISPYRKDPPEVWPGLFHGLPSSLARAMEEPTLSLEETTFCFWAESTSDDWTSGAMPSTATDDLDGSANLLRCFRQSFVRWAASFYGTDLDARALHRLWWNEPLDWDTLERLNIDFDERAVREEAELVGWELDLSKHEERSSPPRSAPLRFARATLDVDDATEFVVRSEPGRVVLCMGNRVVASSNDDLYAELFELVRSRLER